MRVIKNYKENWIISKVNDVGDLLRGITYKKEDASFHPNKNYLPVLRANNINGELNFNNLIYVPEKYIDDEQIVKQGDIVFAMSSGSKHLVGKSASVKNDFQGSYGAFCALFRPIPVVNNNYVAFFFKSPSYNKRIQNISKGTNINNLKREHILDLDFPLAPINEQRAIVSKIESLFSEFDSGIENLKKAQVQLKVYRQAVLKWAFEGKLTSAEINQDLPEGWKYLKLKDVTQEKDGLRRGPFGSAIKKEIFVPEGYKVYEQGNAINDDPYRGTYYINEEKYHDLINFKVIPGDLIVSCSGVTLGRVSEIPEDAKPGIINQALLRIRLKHNLITNKYFIQHFRAAFFQKKIFDQSQGTAMPNLVGIKDFREIELKVPPLDEQNRIVQEIEDRLSVCDKLEETIEQSLQQAEALRQSILKKAFEGRLLTEAELEEVRRSPDWEPAEKLLERIKAEKEKILMKDSKKKARKSNKR